MPTYPRVYLQGGVDDAHLQADLLDVIGALNTDQPLSNSRLSFSSAHDDRAVIENLRAINDSISAKYPRRLQLRGNVKSLTAKTNLTNIIQAHNQRVRPSVGAKGK